MEEQPIQACVSVVLSINMDASRDRLEDVLVYPFLFFAVYTIVKHARGRTLEEGTTLEEVVKELPQDVARLLFNRRSGYKNLAALKKAIGPIVTGLQIEAKLDRLVPRDGDVTPQDSPVAWGKTLYNYAEERRARASYSLIPELASSVASAWRRTLQSMWESDECVDIKQLQEQVQRLKGHRLGNAFAEGAVEKISAAVQELSVRTSPGAASVRKRKASSSAVVPSSAESSSSDSSDSTLENCVDLYRQLRHQALPPILHRLDQALVEKFELADSALRRSFCWMLGLLASCQPGELIHGTVAGELRDFYQDIPSNDVRALKQIDHKLDTAFRSRAKQCVDLYKQLYGNLVPAQSQLAAWVLAICPHRYLGRIVVLQHALVTVPDAEVRSHFGAGLSLKTRSSMVAFLRRAMLRDWGMRTTIKGYRAKNDGRCRVYGERLPQFAPDDRRGDHMLVAIDSWAHVAIHCARSLLEFMTAVAALTELSCLDRVVDSTRDMMDAILGLDLLGRPGAAGSVESRAGCYASKFVLDTFFWFALCCTCRRLHEVSPASPAGRVESQGWMERGVKCMVCLCCNGWGNGECWVPRMKSLSGKVVESDGMKMAGAGEPAVRCSCVARRAILKMRQGFGFVGPAFRNFYKQAGGVDARDARCLFNCRGFLEEINKHLQSSFCIYAVQFVPCIWGFWADW